MRRLGRLGTLLAATTLVMCAMSQTSTIQIELSPLRDVYHLGEPIDLKLSIRNTGQKEIGLALDYPADLGVSFSCEDADAVGTVDLRMGGRVPVLRLRRGEEYSRIVALNRYLGFRKPKRFTVDYVAEYMEPVSRENPNPRTFTESGRFVVVVEPGPINKERLNQYVADLHDSDTIKQQEAVEMLLWTDAPGLIEHLPTAAGIVPSSAADVVRALERFPEEEQAWAAILEVAVDGDPNALREAFRVFEKSQRTIPMEFYESILASGHTGKLYPTLEYLLKHGGSEHLRLVRPLEDNSNPEVRKLAGEFITKTSGQGE